LSALLHLLESSGRGFAHHSFGRSGRFHEEDPLGLLQHHAHLVHFEGELLSGHFSSIQLPRDHHHHGRVHLVQRHSSEASQARLEDIGDAEQLLAEADLPLQETW